MGIFSRSKDKRPMSPPPSQPTKQTTTPYPPLSPQHAVYQVPYSPPPTYDGYDRTIAAHGRSQSYPPPPGWGLPQPSGFQPYQQVFVSNNYLLAPPPQMAQLPPQSSGNIINRDDKKTAKSSSRPREKLKSASSTNLGISIPKMLQGDMPSFIPGAQFFNNESNALIQQFQNSQGLHGLGRGFDMRDRSGGALYDLISSKFDAVITGIDEERFSGDERDLYVYSSPGMMQQQAQPQIQWLGPNDEQDSGIVATRALGFGNGKGVVKQKKEKAKEKVKGAPADGCAITSAIGSANYFSKVNLYANSRMPPDLPPVKLYIPTFPLLCIAAQYSERVYSRPAGAEREAHVDSDWRLGTKAMVIKSVPMDSADLLVFAIRGSQTFLDWTINLHSAPSAPTSFLDDPGNLCHSGFLACARKMVAPVAARLRHLLEEDPRRAKCSLLITGHSAGGAVASLLYMHMLSTSKETQSELNVLTGCFRRIHCITFGAPPVSLLPLMKPPGHALRKSLFLGFVNEGDPVVRAEKAYVRSLLDLYSSPAPTASNSSNNNKPMPNKDTLGGNLAASKSRLLLLPASKASKSTTALVSQTGKPALPPRSKSSPGPMPIWPVPSCILSNAGRLILLRAVPLRGKDGKERNKGSKGEALTMDDGVQARGITDQQLRGVVFGDPVCHMMRLYARRVEVLATNAVIGKGV